MTPSPRIKRSPTKKQHEATARSDMMDLFEIGDDEDSNASVASFKASSNGGGWGGRKR